MPLVKHFVHFADAAAISYVHTDERSELVDKFVRVGGFLFLGYTDKRDPVLREGTAHQLPVVAVASHDNCAALRRIFVARQVLKPNNFNVVCHSFLELGEGKNFDKDRAELNPTFLCNPRRFFLRNVEATADIFRRYSFALGGKEKPNQTCQAAPQLQTKLKRHKTNYLT